MIVSKGTSLAVQWLELWPFIAKDARLIPGQGTKIPQAAQGSQNKTNKQKTNCAYELRNWSKWRKDYMQIQTSAWF